MIQRDNILQELSELNSQLAGQNPVNVYTVPAGYFEGLLAGVMKRIKALEAANAADELAHLSPLLNSFSKENPYSVPAGYFEQLSTRVNGYIHTADHLSAEEETATLSPLLAGLKKENPYQVPAGYFENLAAAVSADEARPAAKVVALPKRKWFLYAAAAVVTGLIVMAGFLMFGNSRKDAEGIRVMAKVTKDIKKLDEVQKDDLIDFLNTGVTGTETAKLNTESKSKEIKQLLQDIPEEELKDFQEQTEDMEGVLMTN